MIGDTVSAPVFRGLHSLLTVIHQLLDRPRWSRITGARLRGDRPLPLLCLVGEPPAEAFLAELAHRNRDADGPAVLTVRVDMASDPGVAAAIEPVAADSSDGTARLGPPLLPVLGVLRDRLTEDRFGRQRVRRFRHFNLVDRLSRQQIRPDNGRRERVGIAELLAAWHGRGAGWELGWAETTGSTRAALPAWAQLFVAVFVC